MSSNANASKDSHVEKLVHAKSVKAQSPPLTCCGSLVSFTEKQKRTWLYTAGQLLRTDHKLLCSITLSET
ncbi:hypothetical protein TNCV_2040491 [Trichonephila clavipes]|nr:hypothetical protein TNCV_2040491 [Trichonephila clavipes]